jgi:hypothetical protein
LGYIEDELGAEMRGDFIKEGSSSKILVPRGREQNKLASAQYARILCQGMC